MDSPTPRISTSPGPEAAHDRTVDRLEHPSDVRGIASGPSVGTSATRATTHGLTPFTRSKSLKVIGSAPATVTLPLAADPVTQPPCAVIVRTSAVVCVPPTRF